MNYKASENRYDGEMIYRRCGNSGLLLPALSLGLWHNFGGVDSQENGRAILHYAFDHGITHFDLANNYGPPPGSAEETFGRIMQQDFRPYRDEMIVSTKAGHLMWPGPYGDWGSRKYLIASLNQSLKRMKLDYVDIFYHHRPDPNTPLEETMYALDQIVRQGKALYVGISKYPPKLARKALAILHDLGTPCVIHQDRYSMFMREVENGILEVLGETGTGMIAFSPLSQGLLTNRYLDGIPADSRAAKEHGFLQKEQVEAAIQKIQALNDFALSRGQSLAQMALAWVLKDPRVTSALVGASSVEQLASNMKCLDNLTFTDAEIQQLEELLG